jgi:hypothetical protein
LPFPGIGNLAKNLSVELVEVIAVLLLDHASEIGHVLVQEALVPRSSGVHRFLFQAAWGISATFRHRKQATSSNFPRLRSAFLLASTEPVQQIIQDASCEEKRVFAFRTLRDGQGKTIGLLVLWTRPGAPTAGIAVEVARRWRVPFVGPCSAQGKVVFVDIGAGRVFVFQVEEERGELVFCGNANVAASALAFWLTGGSAVSLLASDGMATLSADSMVRSGDGRWEVESAWRIKPDPRDFSIEIGVDGVPVARVDTLNSYQFTVGPELQAPETFDSCRQKACRITPAATVGDPAYVRVSSCNRFHGGLPQTCGVDLQLARYKFPFIQTAVPTDFVRHPGGVERLPACHWEGREFVALMPRTSVEFAEPLRI